MDNVTSALKAEGAALVEGLTSLLAPHPSPRDTTDPSSSFGFVGPRYVFDELSVEEKRLQSRLAEDHRHFFSLVRAFLRAQPDAVRQSIDQNADTVREVIETQRVWHATAQEALGAIKEALEATLDKVECLYDPIEGAVVLVPDTNALIYAPDLPAWEFTDIPRFDVVLVPTVLSELDGLKTSQRKCAVRARSIIRQIKDYQRCGPLDQGVDVVKDQIRLRSVAIEPRFEESLPWLDPASPDDRFIASFVEVMRTFPRSTVLLVTADINLQNKAAFARLPFCEPPTDPSES